MSRWHRPQLSLVMKKVAGMVPLTLVFADEGKNGPLAPAPSSSIVVGGVAGFWMRYAARHRASRPPRTVIATPAATRTATIPARMAHARRGSSVLHAVLHNERTSSAAPAVDTAT